MSDQITITLYKERLNADSSDIDAALALGNYYYDEGNAAQAIVYYRIALDINPDLPGVRTDLGAMYWRNENLSQAEQAFRDVIAKDSSFGQAYINLGFLIQNAKGDLVGARAVWQKMLDLNPEHEMASKARELLKQTGVTIN
ncbi:MAG: tetratricopeptide repeat protein [Gallionella sp.]